jgi:hypothetical protein
MGSRSRSGSGGVALDWAGCMRSKETVYHSHGIQGGAPPLVMLCVRARHDRMGAPEALVPSLLAQVHIGRVEGVEEAGVPDVQLGRRDTDDRAF